ncbi:MAG: aa3-type cytochrome oxidase subunit IV [Acidimicrobiales bacterium]
MKIESAFLIGVGIVFGCVAIIYWFVSYEDAGTMMLVGTCCLGFLPGTYYLFWHRRFRGHKYFIIGKTDRVVGTRPEDRSDATIEEGAGVISSFPGSSVWPFTLGMGAFSLLLAFVFGSWLALIGVAAILVALVGVTAESRRGGHH